MMIRHKGLAATVLLFGVALLTGAAALGQDKKDEKDKPALSGTWMQKGGEVKVEFPDKETMKIFPHGDSLAFVVVCKITVEKDGGVKAKVSELEGKEEIKEKAKASIPIGLEFRFSWKTKDGTAKMDDFKGDNVEHLKSHMEGEYEKKN